MDCGVVLEGGGARGAYHIGALKALYEKGYNITAVTGTSIGAINGAMIAQGDFELACKLWEDIRYTTLFDIDENRLNLALRKNINFDVVKYLSRKFVRLVKNGGIDTQKIRKFLDEYIDEDKIRKSKIKFGLVTYSLTERKPYELFLEDIPVGMLKEYIMASAMLPLFKQEPLADKFYIDGGVYNNCPIDMLVSIGYKNIIAIKTGSILRTKDLKKFESKKDLDLKIINPRNTLPSILSFESKVSKRLISLGYYDSLKILNNLDGFEYYFNPIDEDIYLKSIYEYNQDELNKIYDMLKLSNHDSKKSLFETVLPTLIRKIGFKESNSYKDVIHALTEYIALKENIEQFRVYDFNEFLSLVKSKIRLKDKNKLDQVIYTFIKNLKFN